MKKILRQSQWEKDKIGIWLFELSSFLLLLLLPTQLGLHLWPQWSTVFGLRVDYLSPTIYLTDVIVLVLLVLKSRDLIKYIKNIGKKNTIIILSVILFVGLNIISSKNSGVSIYRWGKVGGVILFVWLIKNNFEVFRKYLRSAFLISSSVVLMVALGQFLLGRSLGGLFYFLGERSFNLATPGIALTTFLGKIYLRGYSIFSHPNSMGGFEAAVFLLFAGLPKEKISKMGMLISFMNVLISFSKIALLMAVGGWVVLQVYKRKIYLSKYRYIFVFALFVLSLFSLFAFKGFNNYETVGQSGGERIFLTQIAGEYFAKYPLTGVGLGSFVSEDLPRSLSGDVRAWLLQPVHNIFLLALSETGVMGFVSLFVILILVSSKVNFKSEGGYFYITFLVILVGGLFDHYSFTLQQNLLLLGLLTAGSISDTI